LQTCLAVKFGERFFAVAQNDRGWTAERSTNPVILSHGEESLSYSANHVANDF
jgi:hypothetical protein